ncbi:MAG: hypothetical protein P8Z77_01045 [Candidatus Thiodiazotropha sp.]
MDGIPETLPDGQANVDSIDIGSIGNMQVIRGPVSSLYRNASGGALLIETEEAPDTPFISLRPTDHSAQRYGLSCRRRSRRFHRTAG